LLLAFSVRLPSLDGLASDQKRHEFGVRDCMALSLLLTEIIATELQKSTSALALKVASAFRTRLL
jgi:hypothetical protein